LTLIVGPPGTGKTDVAVQIISNVYNQNPKSHILLITRSNQALNHLFQKISNANINPQHLLRLGHGHEDLESGETWSKSGRINVFMERRIEVLKQCEKLAASLDQPVDHAYSCEAAEYFFTSHVEPIWHQYRSQHVDIASHSKSDLVDKFPFAKFVRTIKPELFSKAKSIEEVLHLVHTFYEYISNLFSEISRVRPFELLRTNKERANYLLVKEARVIAMTSTHASIKRRELIRLGFKFDTVVMEEAGQMLEIETFIPLVLQTHDIDLNRSPLSRIVLIGDHHQLPPIIQNQAVAKYGRMEQSMFARLIRLGVPSIHLDFQGRCRPSIADLFRWKYDHLQDLGGQSEYANAGFGFDFQAIDVPDFKGKGETIPRPHFVQNLAEAEYVVATYMFMRLIGYILFM
jgi:intron-binding protein aquarius